MLFSGPVGRWGRAGRGILRLLSDILNDGKGAGVEMGASSGVDG